MTAESPTPGSSITGNSITAIEPSSDDGTKANLHEGNGAVPTHGARAIVGESMDKFSSLINDNIIAARYGVFATITLLTAYGIANTPLFFRYRTVAEVPRSYFVGRRRLYCRIIGVHCDAQTKFTKGNENTTIQILVRHLSPIGMLLPTSWFESLMRLSPSNAMFSRDLVRGGKAEESNKELLRLQVAGVLSPPLSRDSYDPDQFLQRLAEKRMLVSCQLLGRRVAVREERDEEFDQSSSDIHGGLNSGISDDLTNQSTDVDDCQVAICRLTYRPHWQLFTTDLAEELVKVGKAHAASNILNHSHSSQRSKSGDKVLADAFKTTITDTSQRIQDIRNDVKYLDRLEKFEFEAAQKSQGMWSVPEIRQIKKDIVEEADFQASASPLHKIWRMIRGG